MIIKSMPRKTSNFEQLYDYMLNDKHKADKDYIFTNNLFFEKKLNKEELINQFQENYKYTKERKNGNAFYHEVISIKKNNDLTDKEQKEILMDIVKEYSNTRASKNLVYGIMHTEKKDNLHFHLMISSNEMEKSKKYRLSKNQFNIIKKSLEDYLINKYPQLKQEQVFNKTTNKQTKTRNEFEQEKRTGEKSKRTEVKETLKEIFENSKTKKDFFDNLRDSHIEIYVRGQQIGFKDLKTNLKYRLNKIGLEEEFEKLNKIINEPPKQKKEEPKKQKEEKEEYKREENIKTNIEEKYKMKEDNQKEYLKNEFDKAREERRKISEQLRDNEKQKDKSNDNQKER